jgi:hypothetical protein
MISRWDLSAETKLAQMTANEAAIRKAYDADRNIEIDEFTSYCNNHRNISRATIPG